MEEKNKPTVTEARSLVPQPQHEKTKMFIIAMLVLSLAVGSYFLLSQRQNESEQVTPTVIKSYQECIDAGNPVMESYPEQCKTEDGVTFVNPEAQPNETESEPNVSEESTFYQSEISNFSLELSEDLAIIEKQDGAFEGGPVTIIEIASFKLGSSKILESSYPSETSLYAVPKNENNQYTLQMLMDSRLNNVFEPVAVENPALNVDGENIRAYYSDGLFSKVHIFWETDESVFHLKGGSKGGFTPTGYVTSVLDGFKAL